MKASEEDSTVVATYVFRGIEYVVTMSVVEGNSLVVEVEDRLTADQWRGSFDGSYIEDLTHKTGNYKQFSIFINMLESALTQSSDSVSMDLLTYADLEALRNRKAGVGTRVIPGAKSTTINSKRYLILTYTVEFDRIHYPLPLPYMGKPDPRALQETIRKLRQEVKRLSQQGTKDYRVKELDKLRKEYDMLLQEKEELEAEFINFKREINNTGRGSVAKEIRILKSIVKNLEDELTREKTKYQKSSFKRNQEYRQLLDEVEELRASERNLKVRVKSLTNELAIYKRRAGRSSVNQSLTSRRDRSGSSSYLRPSSRENSYSKDTSRHSNASRDRSYNSSRVRSRDRSTSRDRSASKERLYGHNRSWTKDRSLTHNRSSSRERERSASRDRSRSRERNLDRSGANSMRAFAFRSRTPSPSGAAGARYPRFDPTAYVKEKQRKSKESTLKQKRDVQSKMNRSGEKRPRSSPAVSDRFNGVRRNTSRSSSVGSMRSRTSSIESLSDIGMTSDTSEGRRRRKDRVLQQRKTINNVLSSPEVSFTKPPDLAKTKKILASTPEVERKPTARRKAWQKENDAPTDGGESDYFNRSAEISEIDARLSRLQQFMNNNRP